MKRITFYWMSVLVIITVLMGACTPPPAVETAAPEPVETGEKQVETQVVITEGPSTDPNEAPTSPVDLPIIDPARVTGDIIAAGSSTVYPLSEAMAERFEKEGYSGKITIDSIGSGAGFERFCKAGETDIANASRPIKDEEKANCGAIDRNPIEFRIGTDALSVVVSTDNDFVKDLSKEQLALAFSTATTWADIDPSFPAEPIQRFSPGTDSGTFDYFVETIMAPANGDDAVAGETAILAAEGIQLSEDDNVLVQGVAGSPYAIGYFGYAYAKENADVIRPISVAGVEPNDKTAESNEYPLSRPLFMYSDAAIMKAKPQVAAFINYYLTYVDDEILDVGYFPASVEALNQAKQAWLDALGQ